MSSLSLFVFRAVLSSLVFAASLSSAKIRDVFDGLEKETIQKSPEILIAQATLRQKRAAHHSAWAHWLPRLELQLSETVGKDYSLFTSGTIPAAFASITPEERTLGAWALKLTFPLFRRASLASISQTGTEKDLAETQLKLRTDEVRWKLRQLLGQFLWHAYREATLQNSIEIAKTNRKEATLRFELGQRTKVDVLRAEANLTLLESRKLEYHQQRAAALSSLTEFCGMTEAAVMQMGKLPEVLQSEDSLAKEIYEFSEIQAFLSGLAPYLSEKNEELDGPTKERLHLAVTETSPNYRRLRLEEELGRAQTSSLTFQEWPELLLQGALSKQDRSWGNLFSGGNQSYSLSVILNIPLFLGGSVISSHIEKSNAIQITELKRAKEVLQFKDEVENEWREIKALQKSLESLKINLNQNQEIVRLSSKSYQLGKTTMVELLSSQEDLIESKVNFAKAKLDLAVLVRRFATHLGVSL